MKAILQILILLLPLLASAQYEGSFKVSGTRLLDANGNNFVMRGANYSWCWQKGEENSVIPAAKRIGCNTLRIQLGTGRRFSRPSVRELKKLITLCEENHLIAVFNTHDATGSNEYSDLEEAARFWVDMKDLLNAHTATTIVNIANEWFGTSGNSAAWADGYKQAIKIIRDGGVRNTLIIDAAGWGQWPQSIFERASEVASADPLQNVVFAIHMYDVAGKNTSTVKKNIDNALATGYPVIIGEFAYRHGGRYVEWQSILDYTAQTQVGYLVWSWTGNSGGVEDCDMFGSYDDSIYKPNGTNTVLGRNGIRETSVECSIYGSSGIRDIRPNDTREIDYTQPYQIFDITGRRVSDMTNPGIYILRQGSTVKKILNH